MTDKLTFLGLGVMGFPMAGHLAQAGYAVTVYNRTAQKAEKWLKTYGSARCALAATPAQAVCEADLVFACVGADKDVEDICVGEAGAFAAMKPGAVFVDHTTASAQVARAMYDKAKALGLGFLDAPVSGGEAGAQAGQLTVMCGGDQADFDQARPVMENYAKMMRLLGPAGSGQTAKMVNQICIAGTLQGLSEALHFCQSAGLDVEAVVDVISKGAAQSWQMENRAASMAAGSFDFGFAVDWMRKDLAIVLEEARRMGVSLPSTALIDQFYADVQAMGGGRQDTSSLIRRLRH
ncbi:oxidoreductase [Iodidimonas gelatinilytica]|uniref:Oxidoreductase n=1 Tax=Iodidimonas gelatinilytica TaxID=1236966 RepID=A0A5A7N1D8_9PROT|nr:NAD(P)-dependent oxidoreductase [Iodidimonas gelatinilytica]GEQ98338.1 oxidoreductase [Iodidimonas gelatinilytica]GER02083.1 oxidoreductase [Iodidimonas gelatinilytica]